MNLTGQTKTLLAVAAILLLIYLFYKQQEGPIHNEGSLDMNEESQMLEEESISLPENMEQEEDSMIDSEVDSEEYEVDSESEADVSTNGGSVESKYNNVPVPREEMVKYFPQKDYAPPESDWLKGKFNNRNQAQRGVKRSSYSAAQRGNLGPSQWDDYFEHNNNVIGNSQTGENDKFLPIDESNGGFAVFQNKGRATCGSNQNCEPEDLFDVDKYLPQEVNDDWFEVQPEPISVKNRHLINITKPIGVNTIGTSLKNASWDIRGTPANPKYVISPFNNSSIEPDVNLKPMM
jgi:hypothetical protein